MDHQCIQETRIRALETEQAKTEVYYKNIQDDIKEIKEVLKVKPKQEPANLWQPAVIEIIKLITTVVLVLGGLAGLEKFITR